MKDSQTNSAKVDTEDYSMPNIFPDPEVREGVLKAVGGLGEIIVGAALSFATKGRIVALGAFSAAHGVDTMRAGLKQASTGVPHEADSTYLLREVFGNNLATLIEIAIPSGSKGAYFILSKSNKIFVLGEKGEMLLHLSSAAKLKNLVTKIEKNIGNNQKINEIIQKINNKFKPTPEPNQAQDKFSFTFSPQALKEARDLLNDNTLLYKASPETIAAGLFMKQDPYLFDIGVTGNAFDDSQSHAALFDYLFKSTDDFSSPDTTAKLKLLGDLYQSGKLGDDPNIHKFYINAAIQKADSKLASLSDREDSFSLKYEHIAVANDIVRFASLTASIFGENDVAAQITTIGSGFIEAGLGIAASFGAVSPALAATIPFPPLTFGLGVLTIISGFLQRPDDSLTRGFNKMYEMQQKSIEIFLAGYKDLKNDHIIMHSMIAEVQRGLIIIQHMQQINLENTQKLQISGRVFFATQYLQDLDDAELFAKYLSDGIDFDSHELQRHYSNLISILRSRSFKPAVIGLGAGYHPLSLDDLTTSPADNIGLIQGMVTETTMNRAPILNPAVFARGLNCFSDLLNRTGISPYGQNMSQLVSDFKTSWEPTKSLIHSLRQNPNMFVQMHNATTEQINNTWSTFKKLDFPSPFALCGYCPLSPYFTTYLLAANFECEHTFFLRRSNLWNDEEWESYQELRRQLLEGLFWVSSTNKTDDQKERQIKLDIIHYPQQEHYSRKSDSSYVSSYNGSEIAAQKPYEGIDWPNEHLHVRFHQCCVETTKPINWDEYSQHFDQSLPHGHNSTYIKRKLLPKFGAEYFKYAYPHSALLALNVYPCSNITFVDNSTIHGEECIHAAKIDAKNLEIFDYNMRNYISKSMKMSYNYPIQELNTPFNPLQIALDNLTLSTGMFYQFTCVAYPELCYEGSVVDLLDTRIAPWERKKLTAILKNTLPTTTEGFYELYQFFNKTIDGVMSRVITFANLQNSFVNESSKQPFYIDKLLHELDTITHHLPKRELDYKLQKVQKALNIHDFNGALKILGSLYNSNKNSSEVNFLIGVAHLGNNNLEFAREYFTKAYYLDSKNPKLTCDLFKQAEFGDEFGPCHNQPQASGATQVRPPFSDFIVWLFLLSRSSYSIFMQDVFSLKQFFRNSHETSESENWHVEHTESSNNHHFFYREKSHSTSINSRALVAMEANNSSPWCEISLEFNGAEISYVEPHDEIVGITGGSINGTAACTTQQFVEVLDDVKTRLPSYEELQKRAEIKQRIKELTHIGLESATTTGIILLTRDVLLANGASPKGADWGAYIISQYFSVGRTARSLYKGASWVESLLPTAVSSVVYHGLTKTGLTSNRTASWVSNTASIGTSIYSGGGFFKVVASFGVSYLVSDIISRGEKWFADKYLTGELTQRCDELEVSYNSIKGDLQEHESNLLDNIRSLLDEARTAPKMAHYALVYEYKKLLDEISSEINLSPSTYKAHNR